MAELEFIAHALSDPTRMRILELLLVGFREKRVSPGNPAMPSSLCACDLLPHFGDIPPSKLAYHLKILREAGLVRETRRGKWVYYQVKKGVITSFSKRLFARLCGPDYQKSCCAPATKPRKRRKPED